MTRYILISLFVGALALVGCSPKSAKLHTEPNVPHAQLGDNVTPVHYDLNLRVDPKAATMTGVVAIDVTVKTAAQEIWIHGKAMDVKDVFAVQGDAVIKGKYTQIDPDVAPSGVARLTFETPLEAGEAALTLAYETPYNTSLFSAYKVERGEDNYIITQFEPMGAREAFPSFDEPRFKIPFNLTISSPNENVVYANTPTIGKVDAGNGWTKHVFATTRPLPTYLLAFGAGPFDVVDFGDIAPNSVRNRPIALRGLAAKGSGDQMQYALENTNGILTALEEYFELEYPYEKLDLIAAPEYAFGAMENPGAIVYREYLLLLDDNAPLSQKRSHASVHSHELAHQWFGNLVTPVWWEDIWLNEAFATWMGNKGLDLWKPEGDFDRLTLNASLQAMNLDSLAGTRKVREPLPRSENVMDQFDAITYRKGGGVLSMFESYLGKEDFQKGVRLHMERFKDGVATGDDFFKSIADGSGNPDVVSAMKSFVDQPGLPLVSAALDCDDSNCKKPTLILSQSRYAPLGSKAKQGQTWEIPVCIKAGYGNETKRVCQLIEDKSDSVVLWLAGRPDWIMPNENGAGYYRFTLDADGWSALLNNFETLNAREQLAVADSLKAAFRAGQVSSDVYISGLEVLAKSPSYDVASSAVTAMSSLDILMPKGENQDLARFIQGSFGSRYNAIKDQDTVEGNLLTPRLAALLTGAGDDKDLQADFAEKGEQYLLSGNKKAVAPNLLSRALRAVMADQPQSAFKRLHGLSVTGSAFEKGAAIGAMGSVSDPAFAATARELALHDTDGMTGRQAASMIGVMMRNDAVKDDTWEWFKDNFDEFVTTRVSDVRKPVMPGYANFCSAEKRDEVEAFFESKAALIPGYERNLVQTLERIELCAALKSAKSEELAAALKDR